MKYRCARSLLFHARRKQEIKLCAEDIRKPANNAPRGSVSRRVVDHVAAERKVVVRRVAARKVAKEKNRKSHAH